MPRKINQYTNPFIKAKTQSEAPISSPLPTLKSAFALHQQGHFDQAEALYRQLLEIEPRHPDALHLLGLIASQKNNHQSAVDLIGQAIEINSNVASYYSNQGNALKELKQLDAAVVSYDKAIKLKPDFAEAYYNRGNALQDIQQLEDAVDSYDRAISLSPKLAVAYYNRGNALKDLKRFVAAIESYDKAIDLNPAYAEAYSNKGLVLQEFGQLDAALASFDKAITLKLGYAKAYSNRGNVLKELNQLGAAVASFDKAINLKPDFAEAYYNRGNALQELQQLEDAVDSYDRAITLSPKLAVAYYNRGNALKDLKRFDAAIESYDKAIDLDPAYAEAYSNRGVALQELRQLDAALASYDKAIALNPDHVNAYWNKSLTLLLIGDFDKGFNLYEYRWERDEGIKQKRNFSQPLWLGNESLTGKTVLLHAEQGLGDTIQFCRYVQVVADLGAKVILEVQKPLVRLLKDLPAVSTLLSKGDPLPEFEFHCPLMSLPLALRTHLQTIPAFKGYIKAEPERVALWRDRLKGDGLKIGIGWQGSQGTKVDIGRSFDLKLFENISALPKVKLISLQKGYGSEQLNNMPQGMQVLDYGDELDADGAFLDSAAVMMNLDLVITSDTALAHLAGSLGIKTWLALKYVPDWRWLLERKDSTWYPSMTLYRQQRVDEWGPVFDQMRMDIITRGKAL
jgi:tetratricopeptide (TPR) repeat protein